MANPFFTIGHSTRPIDAFVDLLKGAAVRTVVDVRTVPRSRTNPQYNCYVLSQSLSAVGIVYEHIDALGGRRGRQRGVPSAMNAFWENQNFHNYADYALGGSFQSGLGRLRDLGDSGRCAIMCAETLWWRCHRRIITDYLIAAGQTVFHIIGPSQVAPARITPAARVGPTGTITYPVLVGPKRDLAN
jgi:uncharacterized protein (DUF488 family)